MNDNCTNIEQAQYMGNFNRQLQQSNPYSNPYNNEWMNQSNFSWDDQGNYDNFSRPFHQPDFQQEIKQPWEVANNTNSERLDIIEASIKNMEVLLGQLVNSNNSWDPEDLPSQEEIEFDLVEDISEHTEQPSFNKQYFYDDVTDDLMIEIVRTENIEEFLETCLVDNITNDEEEVDFDLV